MRQALDASQPSRAEVDATAGPVVLEFGAVWCGHCRNLAPTLASLLVAHPAVRHVRVEDGPGLPLGRSFGVKLWPTLVFLNDGRALQQLARPGAAAVRAGLNLIDPVAGEGT